MDSTQDESRSTDHSTTSRSEAESDSLETPTVAVARMLANPRRVRRA